MARWRLAEPDPASQESGANYWIIMFYTYILKSLKNGDLYVGFTGDLKVRFREHNNGKVFSTKSNRPWDLVYYEAYKNKKDASRRERQLKEHRAKEELRKQIEYSVK